MWDKIIQAWKIEDIRRNMLFVIGALVIFRVVAHIPVPGVNLENLRHLFESNQILGLMNLFSGGTMENFSIVMLGVGPYITASIIFQLLGMIVPRLEEMMKEGEQGQQKINMYTRWLTVPLAFFQSYAMIKLLSSSARPILTDLTTLRLITIMVAITAGTLFLMWLGELITEKKVGNGVSLLIFAGIVSGFPSAVRNALVNYNPSDLYTILMFVGVALLTVIGVVYISEGQRNIPVSYAKQMRGNQSYGGSTTHLPLRVNMAGVIPIIFAISLVLMPSMVAQFFVHAKAPWMAASASFILQIFQNQLFYGLSYFALVFGFTYFYTAVIFHPRKIAENLQKQGGFIPGIRPGNETEKYLQATVNRINLVGALFLSSIAVLPLLLQSTMGMQSLSIGGTSILIVVSVAIETAKQIEAQLTMHEYDRI
ncbi:preprotein translocase subunit SecY [Patescibacteria group bacterium]|nr:preprotein translocase subunit SecY [Patescibacteria group bacterium]